MARIIAVEIRDLVARTRAGVLHWTVEGRRCQVPGYLLELRSFGGPVLSRVDDRGMSTIEVTARIGVLPRGRAVHGLARAVERQLDGRSIDLTDGEGADRAGPAEPPPTQEPVPEPDAEGCEGTRRD